MAVPPGTRSLPDELVAIKARLEELARRRLVVPVCQVQLTANLPLAATTNTWAADNWTAAEDDQGMFTAKTLDTALSYITIPVSGFYTVHYHSSTTGPAPPHTHAAKVAVNGTDVTANTIATDARTYLQYGSDGCPVDAIRSRCPLVAGDRLYWSDWTSASATLEAATLNVPTEIVVRYLSSQ